MRLRVAVLLGLLLTLSPLTAAPAQAAALPSVVVVGAPGLRWDQVSAQATPTLWRLSRTGSVGSLSIRSADSITCADDGWLSVGAGNRVRVKGACGIVPPVAADGSMTGYADIVRDNLGLDFDAVPGILASSLPKGGCVGAIGDAAALGAADRTGKVTFFTQTADATALRHCPVTLVSAPTDPAAADSVVRQVDAARPAGSVLLVVGLSDLDPGDRAHLHVAIAVGGPYGPGRLRSQSTRRAPYVQLIDVAATVLRLRGTTPPSEVDGQPWQRSGHRPSSVASLADTDTAAGGMRSALPWVVVAMVVVLVAGTALSLTRRRRLAALVLLVSLASPVATYLVNLVPWWRAGAASVVALIGTLGVAGLLAVPAFRLGERRSWVVAAGTLAGVTYLVLAVDVLTGSRLQMDSILGYSPLVAGRFVGLGNVAYGIFGSAAMLLATALAIKRGVPDVVAVGLVAVLVDGAPMWGSDVGGVLALVPGFAVMVLLCRGSRLSWGRLVAIGAAAVGVVLAFALADYSRPAADQTHLGRFIGRILHGGAGTVLSRKLHSDLDLLTTNAATLTVPLLVVGAGWFLLRPRPRLARAYARHPELRYGLTSLAVLSLVGLVVNDSGIAIPAVAVLLGLPYVLVALTGDTPGEPPREDQHVLP